MRWATREPETAEPAPRAGFWQLPQAELERELGSGAGGLTSVQAAERLQHYGPNVIGAHRRYGLLRKAAERFRNPLVLILIVAALISALTGETGSFVIISTIILLSVVLDSLQEHRAETAADRLKASVALTETVLRDGREITVKAEDLVPGDLVLLAAGDLVPADGRLVETKDFFVNEALLTGESYPTEKHALGEGVAEAEIAGARNAGFMGSSVVSGTAALLVVATGASTELGEISGNLRHAPPPAALEHGIHEFGMLLVRITLLLVLFVLLTNILFHRPLLESFLFALALAVGLTPELLPMIVSVTLARGALRMAKERVIVKRLAAIHDLGSMDVLCTDKTGTLTEAKIRLVRQIAVSGEESRHVLELAWLNSHFETGLRSPLDAAILERGGVEGTGWSKLDEVPFDFERRRVSVLVQKEGRRLLVVKGAPEDVLRLSRQYEEPGGEGLRALDAEAQAKAGALFEALGSEGFRVLGIAWREVGPDQDHAAVGDEKELVFAGFAAFLDPPKQGVEATLEALARSGIRVKIVTGDNERVTCHLCEALAIPVAGLLTGSELSALSEEALGARIEEVNLFCRVTPAQKNRIILALKRRGHVVGFMGDGINDAPSLHSADVGISVDTAVDVAKDAADIILLERDLSVLERGVREGRRTFGNVMKYVMMGTSSNFGNMFSMAGASLVLPFLPMLPVQILLNNLLYDLSEMPIPMDEVDPEAMEAPPHWDVGFIRNFMLVLGPVSSLFDFLTFGLLLLVFGAGPALFQTGWFIESLATQVLVIFVIRTRRNPLQSRPSPYLAAAALGVVALAILVPFTALGRWFGFVPPPPALLAALAAMLVCYLLLAEVVKRWFYRHRPPQGPARAWVHRPNASR
ncbi:MAG TPA: magnesium-translocating P-type ATPase [Dongiaceae bacterium]|nr:magnesium-translocating P-type ATPase [Dongiaceae bacterium]